MKARLTLVCAVIQKKLSSAVEFTSGMGWKISAVRVQWLGRNPNRQFP